MYPPDAADWSVVEVHRHTDGSNVTVRHAPTGKCVRKPFGGQVSETEAVETSIQTIREALQRELLVD